MYTMHCLLVLAVRKRIQHIVLVKLLESEVVSLNISAEQIVMPRN